MMLLYYTILHMFIHVHLDVYLIDALCGTIFVMPLFFIVRKGLDMLSLGLAAQLKGREEKCYEAKGRGYYRL